MMARLLFILSAVLLSACAGNGVSQQVMSSKLTVFADEDRGEAVIYDERTLHITDIDSAIFSITHAGKAEFEPSLVNGYSTTCVSGYGIGVGYKPKMGVGDIFSCKGYTFVVQKCLQSSYTNGVEECVKFQMTASCRVISESCKDEIVLDGDNISRHKLLEYIYDKGRGVVLIKKVGAGNNVTGIYTKIYGSLFESQ